jgi:hypothetical protein
MVLAEYIPHQTLALTQAETAAHTGNDTCGILSPVLEDRQGIVNILGNIRLRDCTNETTHSALTSQQ